MSDKATEPNERKTTPGGKKIFYAFMAVVLGIGAIYGFLVFQKHAVNTPVKAALAGETGAETSVYQRTLIGSDDIVFDVRSVSGEVSMVDITRRLLKSAEALKDKEFGRVFLAYQGQEKFYLEGPYFRQLGQEREWQNPVYTIRTLPENVKKLDGTSAYETWTGGLLGVIGGQMEDNNNFHKEWWVYDALTEMGISNSGDSAL